MNEVFNSTQAPEPVGLYPHARRVGNLLFLSGVGPRQRGSKEIPGVTLAADGSIASYDIEIQCRSVFANVKAILEASGASWNDMVDVTVFLTNMKADFPLFNRLYAEYFKDVMPTRTTIEVGALPTPIAVELKVIAVVKGKDEGTKGMREYPIRTCHECGNKSMHRVQEDHTTEMGYLIRNLDFYKCSDCGEKLFDPDAMDRILKEGRLADKRPNRRKASKPNSINTVNPK